MVLVKEVGWGRQVEWKVCIFLLFFGVGEGENGWWNNDRSKEREIYDLRKSQKERKKKKQKTRKVVRGSGLTRMSRARESVNEGTERRRGRVAV